MSQPCKICIHAQRDVVDKLIVQGQSLNDIARQFKVSADGLSRHKRNHLPPMLMKAHKAEEIANGDKLLDDILEIMTKTQSLLHRAESDDKNLKFLPAYLREIRQQLTLLGELQGRIARQNQINIGVQQNMTLEERKAEIKNLIERYHILE